MKYTQYGNWEEYSRFFLDAFPVDKEYIACGVGEGFRTLRQLFPQVKIRLCLDVRAETGAVLQGGIEVLPYESLENELKGEIKQKFIITAGGEYYSEIKNVLIGYGVEESHMCSLHEILIFWGGHYSKKMMASACNVFLLTNCNLKCKGCSQFTPYIVKHRYNSADSVKESLDHFFSVYDYVKDLVLVGGETMLYRELGSICSFIEGRFQEKYHELKIFTNGLVVPHKDVLEELAGISRVHIYISDYTGGIEEDTNLLIDELRRYRIRYTLNKGFGQSAEYLWFDLGDPAVCKTTDMEANRTKFRKCSLDCRNLIDHKMYYCVPACAAMMGSVNILSDPDMYLDLENLEGLPWPDRMERVGKFELGFIEKGYLEFCSYCNGFGKDVNTHYIRAGEQ